MKKHYCLVLLCLCFVPLAFGEVKNSGTQNFEPKNQKALEIVIENTNGPIRVEGWDLDRVQFDFVRKARSEDALKQTLIYFEENDTLIKAWVKMRKDKSFFRYLFGGEHGTTVSFNVRVPKRIKGLSIDNVNGSIQVMNMESKARCHGVNGELQIEGNLDEIQAENVNGAIVIANQGGNIKAENVNGSITISLAKKIEGDVHAETVNGAIEIKLPANPNAEVELENVNGSLKTAFSIAITGEIGKHHIAGKLGNGGPRLHAEAVNGSIELK